MKYLPILFLLCCAAPALAAETLVFACERTENNDTEAYELKISPASKIQKAKAYLDGRDLDRADELGRQAIKNVVVTDAAVLITMEAHFPPESFDGIQYGAGSVETIINLNRLTGQLRKAETIQGGILSASSGAGTKIYQEQCTAMKNP